MLTISYQTIRLWELLKWIPTKILIVVDMLLVGYDVPIVQVMYLDKGLREHTLLQAIARVNRKDLTSGIINEEALTIHP